MTQESEVFYFIFNHTISQPEFSHILRFFIWSVRQPKSIAKYREFWLSNLPNKTNAVNEKTQAVYIQCRLAEPSSIYTIEAPFFSNQQVDHFRTSN